jgi:hypothetical protein
MVGRHSGPGPAVAAFAACASVARRSAFCQFTAGFAGEALPQLQRSNRQPGVRTARRRSVRPSRSPACCCSLGVRRAVAHCQLVPSPSCRCVHGPAHQQPPAGNRWRQGLRSLHVTSQCSHLVSPCPNTILIHYTSRSTGCPQAQQWPAPRLTAAPPSQAQGSSLARPVARLPPPAGACRRLMLLTSADAARPPQPPSSCRPPPVHAHRLSGFQRPAAGMGGSHLLPLRVDSPTFQPGTYKGRQTGRQAAWSGRARGAAGAAHIEGRARPRRALAQPAAPDPSAPGPCIMPSTPPAAPPPPSTAPQSPCIAAFTLAMTRASSASSFRRHSMYLRAAAGAPGCEEGPGWQVARRQRGGAAPALTSGRSLPAGRAPGRPGPSSSPGRTPCSRREARRAGGAQHAAAASSCPGGSRERGRRRERCAAARGRRPRAPRARRGPGPCNSMGAHLRSFTEP